MLKAIYALIDPRDGAVRYIGATNRTLAWRKGAHVCLARKGGTPRVCAWIRELLAAGAKPIVKMLRAPTEDWQAAEQDEIRAARACGANLTNQTDGGLGCSGLTPNQETRAKRSETLRRRYRNDPAQMAQRQELARRAARSSVGREAARAKMQAIWADPTAAEKQRASMCGKRGRSC